jgi:hypothetical protein
VPQVGIPIPWLRPIATSTPEGGTIPLLDLLTVETQLQLLLPLLDRVTALLAPSTGMLLPTILLPHDTPTIIALPLDTKRKRKISMTSRRKSTFHRQNLCMGLMSLGLVSRKFFSSISVTINFSSYVSSFGLELMIDTLMNRETRLNHALSKSF